MHIRPSDTHNVVDHFCLQAFLSEHKVFEVCVPMSCCFSFFYCYFVVFQDQIAASLNLIPAAVIV